MGFGLEVGFGVGQLPLDSTSAPTSVSFQISEVPGMGPERVDFPHLGGCVGKCTLYPKPDLVLCLDMHIYPFQRQLYQDLVS